MDWELIKVVFAAGSLYAASIGCIVLGLRIIWQSGFFDGWFPLLLGMCLFWLPLFGGHQLHMKNIRESNGIYFAYDPVTNVCLTGIDSDNVIECTPEIKALFKDRVESIRPTGD